MTVHYENQSIKVILEGCQALMTKVLLVRLCSLTGKFKLSICMIGGNVTVTKISEDDFSDASGKQYNKSKY
jgi:hypothetical protein